MTSTAELQKFAKAAEKTAAVHRDIQAKIDAKDKTADKRNGGGESQAMQAGARHYPELPMPKQHLKKPGSETDLDLAPMVDAPHYLGSEKLKDKVAIITGGDSGIGRGVAVLYAREGADVVILYLSEHEDARETQRLVEKEGRRCLTIAGDVSDPEFCRAAVARTVEEFGGVSIFW